MGLRSNAILTLMIVAVLLLPIFKGGNFPAVMAIFIFISAFIFLLSLPDFISDRDWPWFIVWFVFSAAVMSHVFLYPLTFVNERFFINALDPRVAEELNSRHLSKMRMVEVWSFFTSMWLFAWRTSILSVVNVKLVLLALFLASSFQALYGLVHFISNASSVLGLWEKQYYLEDATGTFVNRNHFAGMLAITAPLILSSLLMPKPLLLASLSKNNRLVIAACYLVVLMLALISSHSRMGLMVAILGLVSCYFLMNRLVAGSGKVFAKLKFVFVLLSLLLFAIWFGVGDILQRYTDLGDGNSRFDVWSVMFSKMSFDVWLYGAGPGSFEYVFQVIKPNNFLVRFVYAHNDYLEFVFEFGLLFTILIVLSLIYWLKRNEANLKNKNYLRAGIFGSFVAIGLHSLVDFNLQIPASALSFWFAVGLLMNLNVVNYGVSADNENDKTEILRENEKSQRVSPVKFKIPKTRHEWIRFFRSD